MSDDRPSWPFERYSTAADRELEAIQRWYARRRVAGLEPSPGEVLNYELDRWLLIGWAKIDMMRDRAKVAADIADALGELHPDALPLAYARLAELGIVHAAPEPVVRSAGAIWRG